MYESLKIYYDNGGGPCYNNVSCGLWDTVEAGDFQRFRDATINTRQPGGSLPAAAHRKL